MIGVLFVALLQLPVAARTPGVTNPAVTQANLKQTICNPKWSTKSIRPSSSLTTRLKAAQMKAWGLLGKPGAYEEDHLISLELGGHPTDAKNLWPEAYSPKPGAKEKDRVENYLHRQVCVGAGHPRRSPAPHRHRLANGLQIAREGEALMGDPRVLAVVIVVALAVVGIQEATKGVKHVAHKIVHIVKK